MRTHDSHMAASPVPKFNEQFFFDEGKHRGSAKSAKERMERKVCSKQNEKTGAAFVSATQAAFTLSADEGSVEREAIRRRGAEFPDDRKPLVSSPVTSTPSTSVSLLIRSLRTFPAPQ